MVRVDNQLLNSVKCLTISTTNNNKMRSVSYLSILITNNAFSQSSFDIGQRFNYVLPEPRSTKCWYGMPLTSASDLTVCEQMGHASSFSSSNVNSLQMAGNSHSGHEVRSSRVMCRPDAKQNGSDVLHLRNNKQVLSIHIMQPSNFIITHRNTYLGQNRS